VNRHDLFADWFTQQVNSDTRMSVRVKAPITYAHSRAICCCQWG